MYPDIQGYHEIEHTADWELEAWAPDFPTLLAVAAEGMYALAGVQLEPEPRLECSLQFTVDDPEQTLVSFLTELLFLSESEGVGFDRFSLRLEGDRLLANLESLPLKSLAKEIKAVTYHNLKIQTFEQGLFVRIVFDV